MYVSIDFRFPSILSVHFILWFSTRLDSKRWEDGRDEHVTFHLITAAAAAAAVRNKLIILPFSFLPSVGQLEARKRSPLSTFHCPPSLAVGDEGQMAQLCGIVLRKEEEEEKQTPIFISFHFILSSFFLLIFCCHHHHPSLRRRRHLTAAAAAVELESPF